MKFINEIKRKNILNGFIQKGQAGFYADNQVNRKLGRVGQPWKKGEGGQGGEDDAKGGNYGVSAKKDKDGFISISTGKGSPVSISAGAPEGFKVFKNKEKVASKIKSFVNKVNSKIGGAFEGTGENISGVFSLDFGNPDSDVLQGGKGKLYDIDTVLESHFNPVDFKNEDSVEKLVELSGDVKDMTADFLGKLNKTAQIDKDTVNFMYGDGSDSGSSQDGGSTSSVSVKKDGNGYLSISTGENSPASISAGAPEGFKVFKNKEKVASQIKLFMDEVNAKVEGAFKGTNEDLSGTFSFDFGNPDSDVLQGGSGSLYDTDTVFESNIHRNFKDDSTGEKLMDLGKEIKGMTDNFLGKLNKTAKIDKKTVDFMYG